MIVATQKCGCPPPSKNEKPPCSPCCSSDKKRASTRSRSPRCPVSSCCNKPAPKPALKLPQPSTCCPVMPSGDTFQRPREIRSEIADRGLPYKEIEAIINDNRVVIRKQKEPMKPEYQPPCDCNEDSTPAGRKIEGEIDHGQAAGNKTMTVYPRSKNLNPDEDDMIVGGSKSIRKQSVPVEAEPMEICKNVEENPNIFLFRVKNNSTSGDKKFNIDLEFKAPRPWSVERRTELKKMTKPAEPIMEESENAKASDQDKERQSSKQKKKRKKKERSPYN